MAQATPKTPRKAAAKTDAAVAQTETRKTAKKVAAKKPEAATSAKPTTAKKPAAVKPSAAPKGAATKKTVAKKPAQKAVAVSDEQRYRMIAEAAYYRAESCQFKSDPIRDWIEAEKDIATLFSGNK